MAPRPLSLGVQSNPGRASPLGSARLINCYAEDAGPDGKVRFPIVASPGLGEVERFTAGGCRGMFAVDDSVALIVVGIEIIEYDSDGTWAIVGGIPGDGMVTFGRNLADPLEVAIVAEGNARQYKASVVTTVSDGDLPTTLLIGCDAIAGRILYFLSDARMFYSDLNDSDSIAALSFITANRTPDGLVRGIVFDGDVWLFGPKSTEVWQITENADAPFQPLPGANVPHGCIAAQSVVSVKVGQNDRLAWVASDRTVRLSSGYVGERISSHAVERAIQALSDPSEIEAFSYSLEGNSFLVLNSSDWTWVYNATTGLWHEEKSQGLARRQWARQMYFGNRNLVGDADQPVLYEVSNALYTDAGAEHICEIYTPPDHAYPNDVEYNALYIDTLPGSGLIAGDAPDDDPAIVVRWSFNGGRTFGHARHLKTGKIGEYRKRVVTHRLGTSGEDGAVFHLSWSAGVSKAVSGAAVDSVTVKA